MTLRSDDWFDAATTTTVPENCDFVQLPLGNVLPLLIDAVRAISTNSFVFMPRRNIPRLDLSPRESRHL